MEETTGGGIDLATQLAGAVIPVLTPLLTMLLKKAIVAIPVNILPIVAIVIGPVLKIAGDALGVPGFADLPMEVAVVGGGAGVAVREVINQNFTKKKAL